MFVVNEENLHLLTNTTTLYLSQNKGNNFLLTIINNEYFQEDRKNIFATLVPHIRNLKKKEKKIHAFGKEQFFWGGYMLTTSLKIKTKRIFGYPWCNNLTKNTSHTNNKIKKCK